MNSPTHISVAVALLGSRKRPKDTAWIIWGAILPDLPMYILLAFDLLRRVPMGEIWDERYFQDYWQIPLHFTNSIPIYLALIAIAYIKKWRGVVFLSLAAILHILLDLPLHREDAHASFWPLSDWKFISPISYWDDNHHGDIVMPIEMILLVVTAIIGARVFVHKWSKYVFLATMLFMPVAYFGFSLYQLFGS